MLATLHKAHNNSYSRGKLTVHYTHNIPGTPYPRVRALCGQSHRRSYFGVITTGDQADAHTVNCEKCLAAATKLRKS